MPSGGKRQGSGRPKLFPNGKIQKTVWLSPDIADWLSTQVNQSRLVESLLRVEKEKAEQ